MPCRDYRDDDCDCSAEQRTIDSLTQMLCLAVKNLEAKNIPVPSQIDLWWQAHKREDAARLQAERERKDKQARKAAILAKLSKEDKKLLGL